MRPYNQLSLMASRASAIEVGHGSTDKRIFSIIGRIAVKCIILISDVSTIDEMQRVELRTASLVSHK